MTELTKVELTKVEITKPKSELLVLTKREHFAGLAMQGLLVNMGRNGYDDLTKVVEAASICANALLKTLEQDNE